MSTEEIIQNILLNVAKAHVIEKEGNAELAEEILRIVQLNWNKERPLPLHTLS